jgi:Ras-related protein Rab-7A
MSVNKICYKIVVIGDITTGKTSYINKYVNNYFHQGYKSTIGADLYTKEIYVDNNKINLQIWDTAGSERFHTLTSSFYRGADACILLFDLHNHKTFYNLESWIDEFLINCNPRDPENYPFMIIGNKMDLCNRGTMINDLIVQKFCDTKKIKYFSVSVKDNINISLSMNYLINLIRKKNSINDEIIEYHAININDELVENYDNKNIKINKESSSNYGNYCYC